MGILYQESDIVQFILSDPDRELGPVRVSIDSSISSDTLVNFDYFNETWSITLSDPDGRGVSSIIDDFDLVDLFDYVMMHNQVYPERESDLMNCLIVVKDFYRIREKGGDRPGWRHLSDLPAAPGRYCVGRFSESGDLDSINLVTFDGTWNEDTSNDYHYWFDDVLGYFR